MKKLVIGVICFIVVCAGLYTYIKIAPPLSAYPSGAGNYGDGDEVQLVSMGNKSAFGDIQIEEVIINENVKPAKAKIQESYRSKGFIISDNFDGEEEGEYTFKELSSITLQPNTDPQEQFGEMNTGTEAGDDTIYALTLGHENNIDTVTIKYRHLGISHEKLVSSDQDY